MSTNAFRDYAQFALQIWEEERQRDLSPNRLQRPLGEMQQHVTERESELQRHRAAALAAGRKTGHTQSEVERRVVELFDLCERLLLWERDGPRLTPDERRQREWFRSWTSDPACDYLIRLLNQFNGPWHQINDLAAAYDGAATDEKGQQAEGTGADSDQGEAKQAEGADEGTSPQELSDREKEILQALQVLKADGERRRVSRQKAARKTDPGCKPSTYNKAISSLVKRGFVESRSGPGGGIWLTPAGVVAAEALKGSKPESV
jgi:hypothetical protein